MKSEERHDIPQVHRRDGAWGQPEVKGWLSNGSNMARLQGILVETAAAESVAGDAMIVMYRQSAMTGW